MPTEMELTLEQTQQGVSHEVSNIRVNLFTMKMEILLESISNKLMVGNFIPPTPDLPFTGLDEFVNKPVVENINSDEEVFKVVRKSDDSPIIEHWVSDSGDENVSQTKT
ncbi:hypothetical protein Tco_1056324 [Tanacetum coccineum]|uniref:Uncharacterized protein n=1 Tax=Tanacetum coccineum TaxID=301880 RepID=A0ABQ5H477_9ASTR